jgi:hypothetical protein
VFDHRQRPVPKRLLDAVDDECAGGGRQQAPVDLDGAEEELVALLLDPDAGA